MNRCDANTSVEEMAGLLETGEPGRWPDGWAGWKNTQQAHIRLLEKAFRECPAYPAGQYAGRGIVISVNAKPGYSSGKHLPNGYFPGAWVVVKELRRLGCELPVVFAYLGDLELDPNLARLVAPLGVTCLDLREVSKASPMRILNGWESKAFALLHAPFEQVMYMDADCFPTRDPSYLFDSHQFRHYGSIFWPDLPPHDRPEWLPAIVWENIGLPPKPDYVDFESGQLMIDKRKCWAEMLASVHVNAHSDWYYRFVFGDKSTFHLAWAKGQALGTNRGWAMPVTPAGWNGRHIEQHDFGSRLLFQHATQDKPSRAGFAHPHHLIHRDHCEAHLAELRGKWDGRLWTNDVTTIEEAVEVERLLGTTWEYERVGLGKRPVRFLEDQRIGRGIAEREVEWTVHETPVGMKVMVKGLDGKPTFSLLPQADGTLRGRWYEYEQCEVVFRRLT